MFTHIVFNTGLELASALTGTLIVVTAFLGMSFSYTRKRSKRHYAVNRTPAPRIAWFSFLSKFMFVSSMLLTLLTFWFDSALLLTVTKSASLQLLGSLLVLTGFINLLVTFKQLGHHYSPSFDAYVPDALVTNGYYRLIRHPVYLFNLFVTFGLAIASGSILVMANTVLGLIFILKIIRTEESYLAQYLPQYQTYASRSWKLVPYFY